MIAVILEYMVVLGLSTVLGRFFAGYLHRNGDSKHALNVKVGLPAGLIAVLSSRHVLQLLLPLFNLPSLRSGDHIWNWDIEIILLDLIVTILLILPMVFINRFLDNRLVRA